MPKYWSASNKMQMQGSQDWALLNFTYMDISQKTHNKMRVFFLGRCEKQWNFIYP